MKKTIFLIKSALVTLLFIASMIFCSQSMPITGIFGVFACAFQLLIIFSISEKASWVRFIIPCVPVVVFILAIVGGFYLKEEPSSGALIAATFDSWFVLTMLFHFFYLVALFPTALNVIINNKRSDKLFLILNYIFCISISIFLYYHIYHFSSSVDETGYPYYIVVIIILGLITLIFPKSNLDQGKDNT